MFENITTVDLKVLSLFIRDYSSACSIRQITLLLDINYSNAFKRIKDLIKRKILLEKKIGHVNSISLNIQNLETIQLLSFVEEIKDTQQTTIKLLIREAIKMDNFSCIGLFGSRVSGKAKKHSDWDVFIITQKEKRREMEKIIRKFPHSSNVQAQVFSLEEFKESLLSPEETVVKHIIRNKQILYNPHPFYNIISEWERIKYAPSQES